MINKRVGAAALASCAVLALSACNPAAQRGGEDEPSASQSAGGTFTKEVSGTLKISGFNPGDEVGQSRADYAKQQLAGVTINLDTTSFDPQKFAAQAASGSVRWKAVSKQATWGRPGTISATARMPAALCG